MAIFGHTDESGDSMEVLVPDAAPRSVRVFTRSADGRMAADAVLNREDTERLYNALGAHLYPTGPGKSDAELTEALKAFNATISGAVDSIAPLWAKSLAVTGPGCQGCTPLGCTDPAHGEPLDPEPKDVGHPGPLQACNASPPVGARFTAACLECGFMWARHRVRPVADVVAGPTWDDQLWAERASAAPAKTAEVPQPWTAWSRCPSCTANHLGLRPVMCGCGHCDWQHAAGPCDVVACTCEGLTVSETAP